MAYAEKVYKIRNGKKTTKYTWRARYLKPDGDLGSKPGFPTKPKAVAWGNEQERLIEAGTWVDPEKRGTHFGVFAREFMAAKKKRGRTIGTRWDNLELHILPKWEHTPLGAISWFAVDTWQQTLGLEDVRRGQCVSLMSTILTGAVDAGYITVNPLFARRRTRDTSGDAAKPKAPKVGEDGTVRPEDAILLAERLGPAIGTHVLTTAFAGLRWGEGLGLHRDNVLLMRRQPWDAGIFECPIIRVVEEYAEYQERDTEGNKIGYMVKLEPTKTDGSTRDVDVPPFLALVLRHHLQDWPHDRIFCTPSGTVWRRGNWSRTLRPACDGRPEREKRRGVSHREEWTPIVQGLDMQALRRLHDTLQAQIGVKEPLAFQAAGHRRPGIKRRYQMPTPPMRVERLAGLQEVFERAMGNLGMDTLWGRVSLRKGSPWS